MNNIVTELVEIINNNPSLIEIEMSVEAYFTTLMSDFFSQAIERVDLELIQEYKEEGYEIDRIEKRTIQFSHGPIELKKTAYAKKGMKSIVPLDAAIGLAPYKRYSPLVEMKAVSLAADSVYRKASDAIIGQTKRHEHFRDAYHVNRKIKERLSFDKKMANLMIRAVRLYDQEKIRAILHTTLSRINDDEKEADYSEAVVKLEKYIERNWESIKPLKMRDLPVQKGLGFVSNHRPFSYRMKRQGRGFSKKGAGNLAAVISARRNKTFLKILMTELPAFKEEPTDRFKYAVRTALKKVKAQPSKGAVSGRIANYGPTSSPMGRLAQLFS